MYSFESKVRFSEVDTTHTMTLPAIINYFQDCSTQQSEEMGLGIKALKDRGKAWILSSWQIEVERYPEIGENIRICTWPTAFNGLFGLRNYCIIDSNDVMIAKAHSIWVFMDIEKARPAKPSPEDVAKYQLEEPLEMNLESRKITVSKEYIEKAVMPVYRYQIDTNNHVNNCQYIQMALEVAPEYSKAKRMQVEYKKSAVLGDEIHAKIDANNENNVVLMDEEDNVFTIVKFT